MKFVKKLVMLLMILSVLFGLFVFIYTIRPDIIDAVFHPDQKQEAANISGGTEENHMNAGWQAGDQTTPDAIEKQADSQSQTGASEGLDNSGQSADAQGENISGKLEGLAEDIYPEYVPPKQSDLVVPAQVSGRNGYQQVQEEGQQIGEDEAKVLESQLGLGETGDGLIFDAVYYPYYGMLDEKGKHLYRQIYANANALNQAFAPVEQIAGSQLKNIFAAVYNDHPELFWLETAYRCKYKRDGTCVEIGLQFNRTARNLEQEKAVFNENANAILNQASSGASAYEKERMVHDILIDRITYDLGAEMNQSAYSAMVNGRTVCAGYARAFQYLLQQLGIPCYYCIGYAGENHAWNIVSLEDGYYNVDVTWDDTEGAGGNYDYFNQSDQDYADTHVRKELSVYLPPCGGGAYRNLEQTAEPILQNVDNLGDSSDRLRSLADVGMSENDILYSLSDYYNNCYNQITTLGRGNYEFSNVIEGEALLEEMQSAYRNGAYRMGYMEQAMEEISASSCEMSLLIEELEQGRYLITHAVNMR